MKGTKIGVLFLALMVGMAGIGASYALWYKTITLTGTVATGNVDIVWSPFTDDDNGIDPSYDKDVADCEVWLDPLDPEKAYVKITNGYPSYTCTIVGDIHNPGSIPVILHPDYSNVPAGITVTPSGDFVGLEGYQLDPDSWGTPPLVGDFKIHVEQEAAQNHEYTFTLSVQGNQWNEP